MNNLANESLLYVTLKFFLILAIWIFQMCPVYGQNGLRIGSTPNPTGSGAHAMGMGNAFIAVADDATATLWNPAGLLQIENVEFSLAYEYFTRAGELDGSSNHPESDSNTSLRISELNYISIVIPRSFRPFWREPEDDLDRLRTVFSLSFLKQFRYDQEFSFDFFFSARPTLPRIGIKTLIKQEPFPPFHQPLRFRLNRGLHLD